MNEEQLKVWESSLMEKLKAENEAQSKHIIELQKEFMAVKEKLLRDHFAGLAMQGVVSNLSRVDTLSVNVQCVTAKTAYALANAMLAERERAERKPLSDDEIDRLRRTDLINVDCGYAAGLRLARLMEKAHGITDER